MTQYGKLTSESLVFSSGQFPRGFFINSAGTKFDKFRKKSILYSVLSDFLICICK